MMSLKCLRLRRKCQRRKWSFPRKRRFLLPKVLLFPSKLDTAISFFTCKCQNGPFPSEYQLLRILLSEEVVDAGRGCVGGLGWVWGVVWWGGLWRQVSEENNRASAWTGVDILTSVVTWFAKILEWVQSGLTADLSSRDPELYLSQPCWITAPDQGRLGRDDTDWSSRWNSFVQVLPRPGEIKTFSSPLPLALTSPAVISQTPTLWKSAVGAQLAFHRAGSGDEPAIPFENGHSWSVPSGSLGGSRSSSGLLPLLPCSSNPG